MELSIAILWTAYLCAGFAIVQSIEFILLAKSYQDNGVWRWKDLKLELSNGSKYLEILLSLFLKPKNFIILNYFRIIVSISIFWQLTPFACIVLLILHLLTLIRWRGSFNGGSDYVNLMVLMCLSIAVVFIESKKVGLGCILYISFQLVMSYFKAGYLKLKNRQWRRGRSLKEFIIAPEYNSTPLSNFIVSKSILIYLFSWSVMLFEVLFPLSLSGQPLTLVFLGWGVIFHIGNVYFFGLNRFLLSWLCAYPALYYAGKFLSFNS